MSRIEYESANALLPDSFTNTVQAGLSWTASESLAGTIQAGQSKVSTAEMGAQGGASVRYSGERNQLALDVNRQVSPSGLGGFATVEQANGNWSYILSERSNIGVELGWQKSKFNTDIFNRATGVFLQQALNSFWGVRTYYRRTTLSGDGINDVSSAILGVTLSYTHTDF